MTLGELRKIIKETAENGSSASMAAAIDELTSVWNGWISEEPDEGPFIGSGALKASGGQYISGVRVLLGDKNALKWPDAEKYSSQPESQKFAADVRSIPWVSEDLDTRGAVLMQWTSGSDSRAAAEWLREKGVEVPKPKVKLARSLFSGGLTDWAGVLLGGLSYRETAGALDGGASQVRFKWSQDAKAAVEEKKRRDAAARRRAPRAASRAK